MTSNNNINQEFGFFCNADIPNRKKEGNNGNINQTFSWLKIINDKFNEPVKKITEITIKPIEIS